MVTSRYGTLSALLDRTDVDSPRKGPLMWNLVVSLLSTLSSLRDWSRSGVGYGNNTRVNCCATQGRSESAVRGTSPLDNKSWGCFWRNCRPTVINPDYITWLSNCWYRSDGVTQPPSLHTRQLGTGIGTLYYPCCCWDRFISHQYHEI